MRFLFSFTLFQMDMFWHVAPSWGDFGAFESGIGIWILLGDGSFWPKAPDHFWTKLHRWCCYVAVVISISTGGLFDCIAFVGPELMCSGCDLGHVFAGVDAPWRVLNGCSTNPNLSWSLQETTLIVHFLWLTAWRVSTSTKNTQYQSCAATRCGLATPVCHRYGHSRGKADHLANEKPFANHLFKIRFWTSRSDNWATRRFLMDISKIDHHEQSGRFLILVSAQKISKRIYGSFKLQFANGQRKRPGGILSFWISCRKIRPSCGQFAIEPCLVTVCQHFFGIRYGNTKFYNDKVG